MVLFPAPEGPTIPVRVPGFTVNEIFFKVCPVMEISGFATISSEAKEISSARG